MNDTSGRTSGRQFAVYDHDSHSWKMWPDIGLWGSIEYSETVPKTGYMSDGRLYELPTSEPATDENDSSSLLPTPVAQPSANTPENHLRKKPGRIQVTDLAILVENDLMKSGGKLLPTPTTDPDTGNGHARNLSQEVRLLPTPRAVDGQASMTAPASRAHVADGNGSLAEVLGAQLFP